MCLFLVAAGFPPKEVTLPHDSAATDAIKNGDVVNVSKSDVAIYEEPKTPVEVKPSKPAASPVPERNSEPSAVTNGTSMPSSTTLSQKQPSNRPTAEDLANFQTQSDYGAIVRRVMPDDNSCLFHTIAYLLENEKVATQATLAKLRRKISDAIRADCGVNFDEAILQKRPEEYAKWITQQNSWGGAIELMIFAEQYATEIFALDVTSGHANCFGETGGYEKRVYVIFDGIHYDAIVMNPIPEEKELDLVQFIPWDQAVEKMAIDFALAEKKAGKFTNTQSFQILCQQCQTGTKNAIENGRTISDGSVDLQ